MIVSCRVDLERGLPPPTPTIASPSTATFSSVATSSAFAPPTPPTYPPAPPSRVSSISVASSPRTSLSSVSSTVREATIAPQSLRFTILPAPHPLFHQPPGSHNHHLSIPSRFGNGSGLGMDVRGDDRIPLSPTPRSLDVGFSDEQRSEMGGASRGGGGATWGRRLVRLFGGLVGSVQSVAGKGAEGAAKYKGKVSHVNSCSSLLEADYRSVAAPPVLPPPSPTPSLSSSPSAGHQSPSHPHFPRHDPVPLRDDSRRPHRRRGDRPRAGRRARVLDRCCTRCAGD